MALILLYIYGQKWLKQLQERVRFQRMKKDIALRFGTAGARIAEADDMGDVDGEDDGGPEEGWGGKDVGGDAAWGGDKKSRASRKASTGPTLSMQLANGSSQNVGLSLANVRTMSELQALVLREWGAAGGDRRESLMMEYVDASGSTVKVSKATDITMLKAATSLNLLPKRWRSKRETYGRLQNEEPLDSVQEPSDGDADELSPTRAAGGLD